MTINKNKYDPQTHCRKSIRLKEYDYSQAGSYFITICCHDRICRFGYIENDKMILNDYGKIAHDEWTKLSIRFPYFESNVFQIMPNHVHGIIILNPIPRIAPNVETTLAVVSNKQNTVIVPENKNDGIAPENPIDQGTGNPINQGTGNPINQGTGASPIPTTTIGQIVGAYKSLVANACLDVYKSKNEKMGKFWQRDYYEHIVRNKHSYQFISKYIIENPANWQKDNL